MATKPSSTTSDQRGEADAGFLDLAPGTAQDAAEFLAGCGTLRNWDRDVRP